MPSHQVLFRRTDGELLLPALAPFTGALQQSASNSINNYYNRPSYGAQVPVAEPTCLLRSCDQYITGRDLTYQRALEIVENEEYLVAVDTDLIRRRNDDGSDAVKDYGNNQWSMPLTDHLQLTKFLSTIGKRKKREAEAKLEPPTLSRQDAETGSRIFNISGTGFGTLDYDWRSVSDTYVKLGTAAALLFGLAAYIPAPAEPLIPIDLSAVALSNKNSQEPIENIDEKSTIYQVYQENAPNRVDRIDKLA